MLESRGERVVETKRKGEVKRSGQKGGEFSSHTWRQFCIYHRGLSRNIMRDCVYMCVFVFIRVFVSLWVSLYFCGGTRVDFPLLVEAGLSHSLLQKH